VEDGRVGAHPLIIARRAGSGAQPGVVSGSSTAGQNGVPAVSGLRERGCMNDATIRITSPADLLAAVPRLLGFHPQDSLVLLTVAGRGQPLHARCDLRADPDGFAAMAESLHLAVRRNGVRRAVLVAYTDDHRLAAEAVARLVELLATAGATVEEALRADGGRWWSLSPCTGPCCPPDGVPYDLTAHPLTAQGVLDGEVTLPSRQAVADSLVGTDLDAVAEVLEAVRDVRTRTERAAVHPLGQAAAPGRAQQHVRAEGLWVRDRVRRFLADRRPLAAGDVGRLLVAVTAVDVRDVAWSEMRSANAAGHVDLWRDVVRRSPQELIAAPAALLAFAAWLNGEGALAWCALDRCCEAEPDYRLAALLTQALATATPPSSWQPVSSEELPLFAS
jgi:hypothetical protein